MSCSWTLPGDSHETPMVQRWTAGSLNLACWSAGERGQSLAPKQRQPRCWIQEMESRKPTPTWVPLCSLWQQSCAEKAMSHTRCLRVRQIQRADRINKFEPGSPIPQVLGGLDYKMTSWNSDELEWKGSRRGNTIADPEIAGARISIQPRERGSRHPANALPLAENDDLAARLY